MSPRRKIDAGEQPLLTAQTVQLPREVAASLAKTEAATTFPATRYVRRGFDGRCARRLRPDAGFACPR